MEFRREGAGYAWCRVEAGAALAGPLREALERLREGEDARLALLLIDGDGAGEPGGGYRWLRSFPLPVVCAFEGRLEGGAAALALACDARLCGERAAVVVETLEREGRLLLDELRPPRGWARDLPGTMEADALLEAGLVSEIAPAGEAGAAAGRLAGVMASRGPIALQLGKEAIWRGLGMRFEQALRFETDLTLLLQTTKDRAEGVAAFIQKRPPRFTGT